ncbi:MAG: MFS transporter [Dehalococcoidia bacterium]
MGAFAVPGFTRLWVMGWIWNSTRWMATFLGSYIVNDLTGSPLLVQLIGAAMFAPMFFGGPFAGAVADRFDRRRTVLRQLVVLLPLASLLGLLTISGRLDAWMLYPFVLAVGIGGVVDWTSRRALLYDLVGDERASNALALEMVSMSGGTMLGAVLGGAVIRFLGEGQAFLVMASMYGVCWLLMSGVPSVPSKRIAAEGSVISDTIEGLRVITRSQALVGIFAVTMVMNFFYFSFMPLVPVFADDLGVDALLAGILASGNGLGMFLGSLLWAAFKIERRGLLYVAGSFAGMVVLVCFAAIPWYPSALLFVILAGMAASAFGTMQGVLTMAASPPEMRGRAMGALGMAIGTLPFGMVVLGLLAESVGPAIAVVASVAVGFVVLGAFVARFPAVARLR